MGIHLRIKSLDKVFENAKTPPYLVNDFDIDTEEGRDALNSKIYSRYDGDVLDILPSCECKHLTGGYNVGLICPVCNAKCLPVTEREVESTLWLAPPNGVNCFINPQVWMILSDALTYDSKQVNLLEWLTSPTLVVSEHSTAPWLKLKALGIGRGLNYFHDNFDVIMETLFEHRLFKFKGAKTPRDELKLFIAMNRDRIFCKHLPVPSKLNFIMEGTVTSVYADTKMGPALEAIRTICAAENPMAPLSMKKRQAVAVNAMVYLCEYYRNFNSVLLGKKEGWYRKHVGGSRLHFTFRCVITSLSDNHRYDEIYLPWSVAVMTMDVHITNKLLKRGMTPNECTKFIYEHASVYDPLMDEILKELISESPYGGIPVVIQRNPTLARLSAQAMIVTKINTDPAINSMQISVLCLAGPNADFDGDQLNGMVVLDDYMWEHLSRLAPHLGVMDLMRPHTISRNIALPVPVLSTINAWLADDSPNDTITTFVTH
jgi:hypothetical protein